MSLEGPKFTTRDELLTKVAYDGSGNPEYIGYAMPGTATSAIGWQIQKITYSSGAPITIAYPGGDNSYAYVWDNRAGYTYS